MQRRQVINLLGCFAGTIVSSRLGFASILPSLQQANAESFAGTGPASHTDKTIRLFLCGDVMTGRGIDQILPHPSQPRIYESFMHSAEDYVLLAEGVYGPISQPVSFDYIWGDALPQLQLFNPDVSFINLETSVTTSDDYWQGKGINYRMHPKNTPCLQALGINACSLANNHVLDWGYAGLTDTLNALTKAGIQTTGAGHDRQQAAQPAILSLPQKGRVITFGLCTQSSGVPRDWAATPQKAGVYLVDEWNLGWLGEFSNRVQALKQPEDIVICSIHWGGNWGYKIPDNRRALAHRLIDEARVDIVHGHSSHHALGIERYRGRLILYGCGDFINDYEGIAGYEQFRGDLPLLYQIRFDPAQHRLLDLTMLPMHIKRMRLNSIRPKDLHWLHATLDRESRYLGSRVKLTKDNRIRLIPSELIN